ncbi:MAG: NAD(P)H-dependent oxidoreductase [Candidatus Eremiobacteraeota bacterium]|nr:NAD(P)H-dependent oxidoreductase [Candidatus Eremiobacteraeota bacterium]
MKIVVLSGSPKGPHSVTLHYIRYLEKYFDMHTFRVFHTGMEIGRYEKKPDALKELAEEIEASDAVIWCYPVYVGLVPAQMKRFIELVFEGGFAEAFKGKYATTFTTSAHFMDNVAHAYTEAVSSDLSMRYVEGYSAGMDDLIKKEERHRIITFMRAFFLHVEENWPGKQPFLPPSARLSEYKPGKIADVPKKGSRKIVLFTDAEEKDVNLSRMTEVLAKSLANPLEIINIRSISMRGGCLSCYRCVSENECSYKDGFTKIYREHLMPADAIIYAGTIRDRFLSARWKMFYDRSFFNGHRPTTSGKQAAFLFSGPLAQNPQIVQYLECIAGAGQVHNLGIITDEGSSAEVTARLNALAKKILWSIGEGFIRPLTFPGVGAHLLFRDLVYTHQWLFKADHLYYREHGLYDYPQNDVTENMKKHFLGLMMLFPSGRKAMIRESKKKMLEPYQKVIQEMAGMK